MNRLKRQRFVSSSSKEHRWILSYADFLTLLFAFFVFLFSISSLEQAKFKQVSASLTQVFDVQPTPIDSAALATPDQGPDFFSPLSPSQLNAAADVAPDGAERLQQQAALLDIQQQLKQQFAPLIEQQLFSVSGSEAWMEIQIADSITFSPGSAKITNNAEAMLYEVGKILAELHLPVSVEGYSLRQESSTSLGSWQLSAQRAINVLSYLQRAGIQGQRLSATAFGHYQASHAGARPQQGTLSILVAGFGASVRSAGS